jgi:hypothetical protein
MRLRSASDEEAKRQVILYQRFLDKLQDTALIALSMTFVEAVQDDDAGRAFK